MMRVRYRVFVKHNGATVAMKDYADVPGPSVEDARAQAFAIAAHKYHLDLREQKQDMKAEYFRVEPSGIYGGKS